MNEWAVFITALTPIVVAIIGKIQIGKTKEYKLKQEEILKSTTRNSELLEKMQQRHFIKLKYTLMTDMRQHIENGSIHVRDFVALEDLYNEYLFLGGNGEVKYMFEEVKQLERTGVL